MQFRLIYIEITNVCGLACSFCPSRPLKKQIMDLLTFRKVLANINGITKTIALHLWGDPMTLDSLLQYLNLANKEGLKVVLTTSGAHLSSHSKTILAHPSLYQLNFSLNSTSPFSFKKSQTYFQTLLEWCDYHIENELEGFVNLRLWKSDKEVEFFTKIIKRLEAHFETDLPKELISGKSYQLAPRIRLYISRYFEWPSFNVPQIPPSYCHGLSAHIGILSDLKVVPCCMDGKGELVLGDLNTQTLEEILDLPKAKKMRDGFAKNETTEPLCKHCGFRERFVEKALHAKDK
ncbi:MAG: radical SAM protein [Campylobacteraceae bacterium]|nr:radical SAM protein [Campylobacteraceae bacterium]